MAAALQTKAFMGQSLGQVAARRSAGRAPVQVQAFFKKAEKEVKKAAPKGTITQVKHAQPKCKVFFSRGIAYSTPETRSGPALVLRIHYKSDSSILNLIVLPAGL